MKLSMTTLCWNLWFIGIFLRCGIARNLNRDVEEAIGTSVFESIDSDSDGMIEGHEIEKEVSTVGGEHLDAADEIAEGVRLAMQGLDLNDDNLISESDLYHPTRAGFESLLLPSGVADWVRYAVQLPQYAQPFEDNKINWLDFSVLMQNNGKALERDLSIRSILHRQKLVKSMKIVMLGIGEAPREPSPKCKLSTCNNIHLKWKAHSSKGLFPVHMYKLQMFAEDEDDDDDEEDIASWHTIYAGTQTNYDQTKLMRNTKYKFRVQAWNQIGHSAYTQFTCKTQKTCAAKHDWVPDMLMEVFTVLLGAGMMWLVYHLAHKAVPIPVPRVPRSQKPRLSKSRSSSFSSLPPRVPVAPQNLSETPDSPNDDNPSQWYPGDPMDVLSYKMEMEKKGPKDPIFKDRVVWVEEPDKTLADANLNWSRTQRHEEKLFGKKKRIFLRNVQGVEHVDEFLVEIKYKTKGPFSTSATLRLRITGEQQPTATAWFSAFEALHTQIIRIPGVNSSSSLRKRNSFSRRSRRDRLTESSDDSSA